MVDSLKDLKKQNKVAAIENKDILKSTSQQSSIPQDMSISSGYDSSFALPLTPENRTPYDYADKYADYIPSIGEMSAGVDINAIRARNQSGWEQAFNVGKRAIPNIALGTISNLASIADVEDIWNVDDEMGSPIQNWTDTLIEKVKEATPIYRENPGATFDVTDSGYIWDNLSMLLDSAGAFALTGFITGGLLGAAAKGLQSESFLARVESKYAKKALDLVKNGSITEAQIPMYVQKMTNLRTSIAPIALNAFALNQAESIQEATGVYKDVIKKKLDEGYSLDEAKKPAIAAAELDVNINRFNIVSNLTSAGLFTKGAKAIKEAAGKVGKTLISEGLQEAAEEGVNYIAQMEAMQKANDMEGYQWDTGRALSHLLDPQGIEAMALGAIGGVANTALTEGLTHAKHAKDDLLWATKKMLGKTDQTQKTDNISAFDTEVKKYNNLLSAKEEDFDRVIFTNALESLNLDASTSNGSKPSTKTLDKDIQSFNLILNSPSSTEEQKTRAQMAINTINEVKGLALDPTHSPIWGTKNAPKVISNKVLIDEIDKELLVLNETKSKIVADDKLDDSGRTAVLKPIEEQIAQLEADNVKAKEEYNSLLKVAKPSTPEVIKEDDVINKGKEAAEPEVKKEAVVARNKQTKVDVDIASKQEAVNKNIPSVNAGKSVRVGEKFHVDVWNGTSNNLEDTAPVMYRQKDRDDGVRYSNITSPFEMGYEEANDIIGEDLSATETKSVSLVLDKNKNAYVITDNKTVADAKDMAPGEKMSGKQIPVTPSIKKLSVISGGKSQQLAGKEAIKSFLASSAIEPNSDKVFRVGASKFNNESAKKFIEETSGKSLDGIRKSSEIKSILDTIPEEKVTSFLKNNISKDSLPSNGFSESIPLDNAKEPQEELDDNTLSKSISHADGKVNSPFVRSSVPVIAFNSVPWVIDEATGRYQDAGEAIEEYIPNSIPNNIKDGDEIILEAYNGKPIPMRRFDESGNAIMVKDANGKLSPLKEEHNASSLLATGETDIPIAIYAVDKTGKTAKKGRLLGYLNNNRYLSEKKNGKHMHFVDVDPNVAEEEIDNIRKIRESIVDMHRKNPNAASITTKIKTVGSGRLQYGTTENNLSDIAPKDLKLGYIFGGIAKDSNGSTVDISNDIGGMRNGTPVFFVKMANGSLFAVPSFSKTLGSMNTIDGSYAKLCINGIISYVLKNNTDVNTTKALKEYLQQFVFMSSKSHVEASNDNSFVSMNDDFIEWKNGKYGEKIYFSELRGLKGNVEALNKKLANLEKFLSTQKTNYSKDILKNDLAVNGIKSNGKSFNVSNNAAEFYSGTLATRIKPLAKLPNGENVFAVSPVIEIHTDFINAKNQKETTKTFTNSVEKDSKKIVTITSEEPVVVPKGAKVKVFTTKALDDDTEASTKVDIILSDSNIVKSDDEIFGFPAVSEAKLISDDVVEKFIGDELQNPETVSTSDGRILTSDEKFGGMQSIVLAVDNALSGSSSVNIGEVLSIAKRNLYNLSKLYESKALQLDQDVESNIPLVLQYNSWIESLNNIRDKKAWIGVTNAAVEYLTASGIDIKSENSSDISNISDDSVNEEDSIDGYNSEDSGNGWNITDSFYRDPRSYSTIRIKSMMTSLVDTTRSVLGMAPLFDQGEAYRRVMRVVSMSTKRGVNDILKTLQDESDKVSSVIPNNIYKQLLDKLNNSTIQEKIQFKMATNMQRNVFLLTLFDPMNPTDTKVINAQVRDANKLVLNEWQSRLRYILSGINNPKKYLSDLMSEFNNVYQELKSAKNEPQKKIIIGKRAKKLFESIGISLEPESWAKLSKGDKSLYNKGNGYDLGRKTFISQVDEGGMFHTLNNVIKGIKDGAVHDDVVDTLNQGFIRFLANVEAQNNRRYFPDNFRGIDDNKRYNYSLMTPLADTANRLKTDPNEAIRLSNNIFTRHSFLLNSNHFGSNTSRDFAESFEVTVQNYAIKDKRRKRQKENKQMSDADSIFSRLQLFQNATRHGVSDDSVIVNTTNSDKSLNVSIQSRRSTIHPSLFDPNGELTAKGRESLLNSKDGLVSKCMSIVYGEAERMIAMSTATGEKLEALKRQYGEHIIDNGQFFYGYSFLNKFITFRQTSDGKIRITNDATGLGRLDMSNPENDRFFRDKILQHYEDEADRDVVFWRSIGLITNDKFGQYNLTPVTTGYAKSKALYGKKDLKITDPATGKEKVIKVDGILNPLRAIMMLSMEANMNTAAMQMGLAMVTSGDIANSSKKTQSEIQKALKSGKELYDAIDSGVEVILKEHLGRLAADVAPAQNVERDYEFTTKDGRTVIGNPKYRILITKDYMKDTAEYAMSVAESIKGSIPADFEATNGVEWVTVQHKLDSLFRAGKINENDYIRILDKYNSGAVLSTDDLKYFAITAGKPRQVYEYDFEAGADSWTKRVYIKSSEIPLIRQITETFNSDINTLREHMEANGIDRISHQSTVKLGSGIPVSIYTKDGSVVDSKKLNQAMKDGVLEMDFSGFGYQLELPEKVGEPVVTLGSQADSNILEGCDELTLNYRGEEISGKVLKTVKSSINRALAGFIEKDVDDDLGVTSTGKISPTKVLSIMDKSRGDAGLSDNDIVSFFSAIKNGLPALFSNIPRQIESFIFSKYKDAIKRKVPGTMLPQYPYIGKTKKAAGTVENISLISGLLKTRGFDASRELAMTRVTFNQDGNPVNVDIAECILPYKIWGKDGLIDVNSLIETEGEYKGFIDPSKLPDDLLKIVGMRTPNEGHSTQTLLKIVAFSPKIHGDVIYIPTELTLQMGSDYDIDKLTTYWRNMIQSRSGNIIATPNNALKINKKTGDATIDINALKKWLNKHFSVSSVSEESINNLKTKLFDDTLSGEILTSDLIEEFIEEEDLDKSRKILFDAITNGDGEFLSAINKLGRESYLGPSISSISKKIYEDAYFDIFASVLSNPQIASKAMTPLDSDDLKDLAKIEPQEKELLPWFSLRRQSNEYVKRQSTKTGINVFAKSNSAINGAENKGMQMLDEDGNKITFSRLGNLKLDTFDASCVSEYKGAKRTGKKNLAIQLSESLDDRKNDALDPNGLSNSTFGVSSVLSSLMDANGNGLNLEYNAYFLKQRAIRRVVRAMNLGSSVMASKEMANNRFINNAIEYVKNKYTERLSDTEKSIVEKKVDQLSKVSYTKEDLIDLLKQSKEDNTSLDYIAKQIDMLNILSTAKSFSDAMFKLTQQTTFDSRGFRATYVDNVVALDNASQIGTSKIVSNSSAYLSNEGSAQVVDGSMVILNESDRLTTTGNNVRLVSEKISLVKELLGYNDPFIESSINKIKDYTGAKDSSSMFEYVKAAKAMIYSRLPIFNKYNIKDLTNGSLVNEMMFMKGLPDLANNMFIRSLEASKSMKYISIAATPGDSIASKRIRDGFRDLIIAKDQRINDFAHKMIAYEYLAGGSQHASNSIKYIPNSLLERMGFYKQLKAEVDSLNNNPIESEQLLKLYLQNNPDEIRFSGQGNASYNKQTKTIIIDADVVSKDKAKNPLRYIKIKGDHYMQIDDAMTAKINADGSGRIFYKELPLKGGLVDPKDVNKLINDYSSDDVYINPTLEEDAEEVEKSDSDVTPNDQEQESHDEFMAELNKILASPFKTSALDLKPLIDSIGTQYSSWMIGAMEAMGDHMSGVNVRVMTKEEVARAKSKGAAGAGMYSNGELSLNPNALDNIFKSNKSSRFVKEVILHELAHAMQVEAYKLGSNGDARFKKLSDDIKSIYRDAIKNTKNIPVISSVTGAPIIGINGTQLTYGMFTSDSGLKYTNKQGKIFTDVQGIASAVFPDVYGRDNSKLRDELKFALYMMTNEAEFIAEVSSRKHAQDLMGSISISPDVAEKIGSKNNKSILRAILDRFAKLFSSLSKVFIEDNNGNKLAQNSILESIFVQNSIIVNGGYDVRESSNKIPKGEINFNPTNIKEEDRVELSKYAQKILGTFRVVKGGETAFTKEMGMALDASNINTNSGSFTVIYNGGSFVIDLKSGAMSGFSIKNVSDIKIFFGLLKYIQDNGFEESYQFPSSEEYKLPGTVREYLQNADRNSRAAFRYALNNGLFKTQC